MKTEERVSGFKGLDNIQDPHAIGTDTASTLVNLLVDSSGSLYTRPGYKVIYAGTFDSACGNLAISGGSLVRVTSTGIENLGPISGTQLRVTDKQGRTFVSTENFLGVLDPSLREVRPRSEVQVLASEGSYSAGTYLFATADIEGYLPSPMTMVVLEAPGGFLISPRGGRPTELYMSIADGTELYYHSTIPATGTTLVAEGSLGHPVQRQYLEPMVPGVVLTEVGGSLITALGNDIVCSEPLDYEAYNPMRGVFTFSHAVTMVEECVLGITYIGTTKELYIARGETPETWVISLLTPVGVVQNSAVTTRVKLPKSPEEEIVVLFTLMDGSIVAGRNNGETVNLTEQSVAELKCAAHGAVILDGINYTIF